LGKLRDPGLEVAAANRDPAGRAMDRRMA